MLTIQYTKDGGRSAAMAMLPPPPTKPITLPGQCGFNEGGKKEETAKPCTKGRGVSHGKIGLTTMAVTQDHGCKQTYMLHSMQEDQACSKPVV